MSCNFSNTKMNNKPKSNIASKIPTSGRDSGTHSRSSSVSNLTSASDLHSEIGDVASDNTEDFKIDDRVWVNGTKPGYIKFIGKTQFAAGIWAGVLLDEPVGKNDGSVAGVKYFTCDPLKGIFAQPSKLKRASGEGDVSGIGDSSIELVTPSKSSNILPNQVSPSPNIPSSFPKYAKLKVGDRVTVSSISGLKSGILRYVGETDFAKGEFAGIELDTPTGKNDGSVAGKRYFTCEFKCGLFSPLHKVSRPGTTPVSRPGSVRGTPLLRSNSKDSISSSVSNSSRASRVKLGITSLTSSTQKGRVPGGISVTSATKPFEVKVDAKTKEKLDEYKATKMAKLQDDDGKESKEKEDSTKEGEMSDDALDEMTKQRNNTIITSLQSLIHAHSAELSKPVEEIELSPVITPHQYQHHQHQHQSDKNSNNENHSPKPRIDYERLKKNELDEMDLEDDKKSLIHREIDKFRDTYKFMELGKIQIFIQTCFGVSLTLQVKSSDRIENVKDKIENLLNLSKLEQILLYGGILLENCKSLIDYNIAHQATVFLSWRLLGGMKNQLDTYVKNSSTSEEIIMFSPDELKDRVIFVKNIFDFKLYFKVLTSNEDITPVPIFGEIDRHGQVPLRIKFRLTGIPSMLIEDICIHTSVTPFIETYDQSSLNVLPVSLVKSLNLDPIPQIHTSPRLYIRLISLQEQNHTLVNDKIVEQVENSKLKKLCKKLSKRSWKFSTYELGIIFLFFFVYVFWPVPDPSPCIIPEISPCAGLISKLC